jgi:membrane protein
MDLPALLKSAYASWKAHEGTKMGASLAYYAVLSLAPLVIIVVAIVGLVFGHDAARQGLITQVQGLVGPDGASMINTMITNTQKPSSGLFGTVIGIATLLFGASGVFAELRDSLNKIWEVKTTPGSGVWAMIRERFLTFGMVLGIGFLLLVSLLLSAALAAFGKFFGDSLPLPAFVLEGANMLISIIVIMLLFAAIYRFLPAERLPWSDLWIGSFGTALLFVLGKFLLGLYLGHATVGSAYGAAGSLIVLLVWIYYTAQLFFLGAEFTRAYSQKHGSRKAAPVPAIATVFARG